MGAAGGLLVSAPPTGVGNHLVRIGRLLMEDELRQQVANLGHTQLEARGAGRRPFFRGVCRPRMAARKAWA